MADRPLYLKKGGPIPMPPAGEIAVAADSAGQLVTINESGTKVQVNAPDPGTVYTVSGNQTDFDITSLLGNTDGDYNFSGRIIGNGTNPAYTLRPNAVTTEQQGIWFVGGVGASFDNLIRLGDIVTATETILDIQNGKITTKAGRVRFFQFVATAQNGTTAAVRQIISSYTWTNTAAELTSIRIHSSVASGIGDTSWFKLQKLLATT